MMSVLKKELFEKNEINDFHNTTKGGRIRFGTPTVNFGENGGDTGGGQVWDPNSSTTVLVDYVGN